MADKTGIGWTDATWNPVVGCSIVSPGCTNCYAMKQAGRIERMAAGAGKATHYAGTTKDSKAGSVWTGKMAEAPRHIFEQPIHWTTPRMIFANSMSDLFHERISDDQIDRAWGVMACSGRHTFQVLTKRADRMRDYLLDPLQPGRVEAAIERMFEGRGSPYTGALRDRGTLPNVWLGVSAEDQARADERVMPLSETPAAIRFVSYEPALGPINFAAIRTGPYARFNALTGDMDWQLGFKGKTAALDWLIIGGESGDAARPFNVGWAEDAVRAASEAGVAVFMKQLGSKPIATSDMGTFPVKISHRKGERMDEWPESIRVQRFPDPRP